MPAQNTTTPAKTFLSVGSRKLLRLSCLAFVGLSFVLLCVFNVGEVGESIESKNGNVLVSAGTHPAVVLWAIAALGIFAVLMLSSSGSLEYGVPKLRRRFSAFLIDFWFGLVTLSSLGAFIPLWLEFSRTGHFQWRFERDYMVSTDNQFVVPNVFAHMALLFLYFAFPLTRGKQTVGCFIMRTKVVPPFGDGGRFTFRLALKRTLYEFVGVCHWWLGGWKTDSYGRTWCDRETNCSVVLLEENSPNLASTE